MGVLFDRFPAGVVAVTYDGYHLETGSTEDNWDRLTATVGNYLGGSRIWWEAAYLFSWGNSAGDYSALQAGAILYPTDMLGFGASLTNTIQDAGDTSTILALAVRLSHLSFFLNAQTEFGLEEDDDSSVTLSLGYRY